MLRCRRSYELLQRKHIIKEARITLLHTGDSLASTHQCPHITASSQHIKSSGFKFKDCAPQENFGLTMVLLYQRTFFKKSYRSQPFQIKLLEKGEFKEEDGKHLPKPLRIFLTSHFLYVLFVIRFKTFLMYDEIADIYFFGVISSISSITR